MKISSAKRPVICMGQHLELPLLLPHNADLHAGMADMSKRYVQLVILGVINFVEAICQCSSSSLMKQLQRPETSK